MIRTICGQTNKPGNPYVGKMQTQSELFAQPSVPTAVRQLLVHKVNAQIGKQIAYWFGELWTETVDEWMKASKDSTHTTIVPVHEDWFGGHFGWLAG